jgi:hypothetical protein
MSKRNFLASPRKDGSWIVKISGKNHTSSIHESRAKAWKETRMLARGEGSEAILMSRNGKISSYNVYGEISHLHKD